MYIHICMYTYRLYIIYDAHSYQKNIHGIHRLDLAWLVLPTRWSQQAGRPLGGVLGHTHTHTYIYIYRCIYIYTYVYNLSDMMIYDV